MTYQAADFSAQSALQCLKAYGGGAMTVAQIQAAVSAMAASVGADPAQRDMTLQTPVPANNFTRATVGLNRDILQIVNRARGGNLSGAQMQTALNSLAAALPLPPRNTALPVIGGSLAVGGQAVVSTGSWSGAPRTYAYQWFNSNGGIAGATLASYTCQAGDEGLMLHCEVTATNAYGASTVSAAPAGPVGP